MRTEAKIINLFGGPSCGKSTIAAGLFYEMKIQGFKVELVTEYAKELVYDGHQEILRGYQEVIFAEQNRRVQRLRDKVNYVITDSPVLLSSVYPQINQTMKGEATSDAFHSFNKFVFDMFHTYDNINFLLNRPDNFQDYGREHNFAESIIIDSFIEDMLYKNKIPFSYINTGHTSVSSIIKMLTEQE